MSADNLSSLGHLPGSRWEFDETVTSVFTDMLSRSIPQYPVMRQAVFDLGMTFVSPGGLILDLGCSRGDGLAPFVETLGDRNRYLGIELSRPMLDAARHRFADEIARDLVEIQEVDLRNAYPEVNACLTLCVLSLQFIPLEYRQKLLADAYKRTNPGGGLLLVEKVLGASASINAQQVNLYHTYKRDAGYTAEEVERKKLSLEGVLVPVTARWNEELLLSAGFKEVDCFWRWMNFAGWIAKK
jgi:tRNA (cmo5U34)-methyltransferase